MATTIDTLCTTCLTAGRRAPQITARTRFKTFLATAIACGVIGLLLVGVSARDPGGAALLAVVTLAVGGVAGTMTIALGVVWACSRARYVCASCLGVDVVPLSSPRAAELASRAKAA